MNLVRLLVPSVCLMLATMCQPTSQQSGGFEFPVQLIGFPVIILAVRISNFLKKLSYAISPSTYKSRSRRDLLDGPTSILDVIEVEKRLIKEYGARVCIYEDVCEAYAKEAARRRAQNHVLDWQDIFKHFESSPVSKREFYLLSVFLGDIVASPSLCKSLAKRGRTCGHTTPYRPISFHHGR